MPKQLVYLTRILNRNLTAWLLAAAGVIVIVLAFLVPPEYRTILFGFHEYLSYLLVLQMVALAHVQLLEPNLLAWRIGRHPSRAHHAAALHLAMLPYVVVAWVPMLVEFHLSAPSAYAFGWAALIRLADLMVLGMLFSIIHLHVRHSLAALSVLVLLFVIMPNQLASSGFTPETGWPVLGRLVALFRVPTAMGNSVDFLLERDFLHATPLYYAAVWAVIVPPVWVWSFRKRDYH